MEAFTSALGYEAASLKLHEFFHLWLSQPETARVLRTLVDAVANDKPLDVAGSLGSSSLLAALCSPSSSNSPRNQSPLKGVLRDIHAQGQQPPRSPTSKGGSSFSSPKSSGRSGRMRQLDRTMSPDRCASSRSLSEEGMRSHLSMESSSMLLDRENLPTLYERGECGRGKGRPLLHSSLEERRADIMSIFSQVGQAGISVAEFVPVTKTLCGFPSFFNAVLFSRIISQYGRGNGGADARLTMKQFISYWKEEMEPFDNQDRFFRLVKQPENDFITKDDFMPFINELLLYHPGLEFLEGHPDFHPKYTSTVISRIFYIVNRARNGRITQRELRRSNLVEVFEMVDEEEDINKVTQYFSYEHFYVLFCRFYELDVDRTNRLTREHLLRYGDHGLSNVIVNRIFDAGPRPFEEPGHPSDRSFMSYEDYVFFMLSEEDRGTEQSIRYWFQCCDLDGDGRMDHMDMQYFYDVQMHRLESLGHEVVPYEDMICQMWDLLRLGDRTHITLEDFLQPDIIKVGGVLFDCLFNINKFICFEQRDPFSERAKRSDPFETDWDRFAFHDYNRLAAEDEEDRMDDMGVVGMDVSDDWDVTDDDQDLDFGGNASHF